MEREIQRKRAIRLVKRQGEGGSPRSACFLRALTGRMIESAAPAQPSVALPADVRELLIAKLAEILVLDYQANQEVSGPTVKRSQGYLTIKQRRLGVVRGRAAGRQHSSRIEEVFTWLESKGDQAPQGICTIRSIPGARFGVVERLRLRIAGSCPRWKATPAGWRATSRG